MVVGGGNDDQIDQIGVGVVNDDVNDDVIIVATIS